MKSIFLAGAVQAFFLAFLMLSKRNKITADYILAVWLTITGIPLLLYFFNYETYSQILGQSKVIPTNLMIVNIPMLLIQSPFLYIYVNSAVKNEKKFKFVYLLNFIPVLLFILSYAVIVGFSENKNSEFNIYNYPYHQIILTFFPLTVILAFYYIIKSYLRITEYKKKIRAEFSYTENIDFKWLKILIIIIAVVWIVLGISGSVFKKVYTEINIQDIVLITASVAIFVIGYLGFIQSNVFAYGEQSRTKKNKKNSNEQLEINDDIKSDIKKIKDFMEKEKPWLEPKLSVRQLAEMINMQSYRLSGIINDYFNKNFFDFVNEYRVEAVKKMLEENKNYTILALAYECGFNSKSSFNRIFKNYTGMTPSEYQKKTKK